MDVYDVIVIFRKKNSNLLKKLFKVYIDFFFLNGNLFNKIINEVVLLRVFR